LIDDRIDQLERRLQRAGQPKNGVQIGLSGLRIVLRDTWVALRFRPMRGGVRFGSQDRQGFMRCHQAGQQRRQSGVRSPGEPLDHGTIAVFGSLPVGCDPGFGNAIRGRFADQTRNCRPPLQTESHQRREQLLVGPGKRRDAPRRFIALHGGDQFHCAERNQEESKHSNDLSEHDPDRHSGKQFHRNIPVPKTGNRRVLILKLSVDSACGRGSVVPHSSSVTRSAPCGYGEAKRSRFACQGDSQSRTDARKPQFLRAKCEKGERGSSLRLDGGHDRDRTCDPYHVKVVLSR
jgi:hypothetical protein